MILWSALAPGQNLLSPESRSQLFEGLSEAQKQEIIGELQRQRAAAATPVTTATQPAIDPGSQVPVLTVEPDSLDNHPRAKAGSLLILNFDAIPGWNDERRDRNSDPVKQQLRGSKVYKLDENGILSLLGLEFVPLLGLDEEQIELRLRAEPLLAGLRVSARILQGTPVGIEAIKPFGYDMFDRSQQTLDASAAGPVPADYILGPGDTVRIQLFGSTNQIFEHEITRDGNLNLPEIGPVTVAGISFSEFRQDINRRVQQMLIGTQASVTMGQLRSIQVFVLGDVNRPGSYVVNGLATMSAALYRSGGVSSIGSLREVQLKRGGRLVSTLDLYALLLNGDTSQDVRLQSGDVIFIPPIGKTIGIVGAVKRPAIYEVKDDTSIAEAVTLAGGLLPEAFPQGSRLDRIGTDDRRGIIEIDLLNQASGGVLAQGGDVLMVPTILPGLENTVALAGHVYRPGPYQWHTGMRLTDLIGSYDQLKPGVDANYVLVRREGSRGEPLQAISADLAAAIRNPNGAENIILQARDTVHVFSLAFGRQQVIEPLLDDLRLQASHDAPFRKVDIVGNVRAPGEYPLEDDMRVADLVRAGGSLSEKAYAVEAELTRYSIQDNEYRVSEVLSIDLAGALGGRESANILLREHDNLRISAVPEWDITWTVRLDGEVRFPGSYRIRKGEKIAQLVERAGGLTDRAYTAGAVFLRESLRQQEQDQIDALIRRLEADLGTLALGDSEGSAKNRLETGRMLLNQLRNTEAVGRLIIDVGQFDGSARSSGDLVDVTLQDGDTLMIPPVSQVVSVIGEVQQNTSHLYREGASLDDYLDMSGGLTRRADGKHIYVVRASGALVTAPKSNWLGRSNRVDVHPGDTIVVPLTIEQVRPLMLWTSVTQILYQAAIAAAAVKTFNR